ncbi:MAG: 2-amino-4-hydroxy-6-hydroxymethyldihydropteridine diphosphokinase [Acidimicrobiia bacterium]|nr:2-amino-4-hydroxy-6-hydroxymethyldihydropteridine diphosphokinase [Acidimicrobiia bacterium]
MTRAYLALGSNLGDRLAHLQMALDALADDVRVDLIAISSVYETDPVGGPVQDDFLNAVLSIETEASPHEILAIAQSLEVQARRERKEHWGPRTLDVDLLLYGDELVSTPDLEVPHPRMWERAFVLAPLSEIAPELADAPAGGWTGVRRIPVALVLK